MEKRILGYGLIAGAVAGLIAFIFDRIFTEPVIGRAIDYEGARDGAKEMLDMQMGMPMGAGEHEVFTRNVQENFGLFVGIMGFGIAMGLLFAVVYAVSRGRVGNLSDRNLALTLAAAAFFVVYVVPFAKYPANPPSVGNPDTIGQRTGFFLLFTALSIVAACGALWLGRQLAQRVGNWNAILASGAAYVVVIGILLAILPTFGDVPKPLTDADGHIMLAGFSADDLYAFRGYAIVTQALVWGAIALTFVTLARLGSSRREHQLV